MRQTQGKVFSKTVKGKESSSIPKALLDLMQRDVLHFHSEAISFFAPGDSSKRKLRAKKKNPTSNIKNSDIIFYTPKTFSVDLLPEDAFVVSWV